VKRRDFITLLGGAAAWPLVARAQQPDRTRLIGILSPGRPELPDPIFNVLNAFLQRLHEIGYTEGQNLTIERHFANGSSDRLRELAAELVRRKPDLVVAFSTTAARPAKSRERAQALIVMPSPMLFAEYRRIVAENGRLPAMGAAREFADLGGLMSYGANQVDLARQAAPYVDKILKGAKPAELPVEQPIKLELVINLKAARELGLTISREFLLLADEVIE
jgi:ABC-type uncharacterized transport system substrate-binding protein